jgi:hypothetical protein
VTENEQVPAGASVEPQPLPRVNAVVPELSLPYHIGNGWFGGLLPATGLAIVAQTGNMYNGLWYPIIFAAITFVVGMLFVKETKDVDIYAKD